MSTFLVFATYILIYFVSPVCSNYPIHFVLLDLINLIILLTSDTNYEANR
jgi:hypothetical protein